MGKEHFLPKFYDFYVRVLKSGTLAAWMTLFKTLNGFLNGFAELGVCQNHPRNWAFSLTCWFTLQRGINRRFGSVVRITSQTKHFSRLTDLTLQRGAYSRLGSVARGSKRGCRSLLRANDLALCLMTASREKACLQVCFCEQDCGVYTRGMLSTITTAETK